ncbi:MAG: methionine synthase [Haliea sp.]|tara:strand:- start:259 stop:372 length:114 start_codon:yes stop_codon:yes gene_type:complete
MSGSTRKDDGMADAIAATAIIAIVVVASYLWLAAMPG